MLTFGDIQNDIGIQNIAGCVPTSAAYANLANNTVDRLLKRGDWTQSLVPIRVCVSRGCVTWPRYVGQIRKINTCRRSTQISNVWYEFMDNRNRHNWEGWCGGERHMTMQFKSPTYQDIYGPNCQVRVYPRYAQDIGATVQIFGIDNNGQPLQQQINGVWSNGITITVASPYGVTPGFVTRIDRVVKSVTQGPLNMYAWDTVNNQLWDLAQYEPSETSPDYLRYELSGGRTCFNGTGNCPAQETVIALVKLKHVNVSLPSDLIAIDNLGAIKFGFMALKAEDAKDIAGAGQFWLAAVAELNAQLADDNPEWQMPVDIGPFRGNTIGRQSCF